MQDPAKAMKIASVIILIYSVLAILTGILTLAGGGYLTNNASEIGASAENDADVQASMDELGKSMNVDLSDVSSEDMAAGVGILFAVMGIIAIVRGIYRLIYAIVGLNAAKGKAVNAAFVLGIIDLVITLLDIIASVLSGSGLAVTGIVAGILMPGIYVYSAYLLKKEAETVQ